MNRPFAAALALLGFAAALPAGAQKPLSPLAYVRRLVLAPPVIATLADTAPPARPPATDKRATADWLKRMKEREQFQLLRSEAPALFRTLLERKLPRVGGLQIAASGPVGEGYFGAALGGGRIPKPDEISAPLALVARRADADAALLVAITRYTTHMGAERSISLQLAAYVGLQDGAVRGPFFAEGHAGAVRWLIGTRFQADDTALAMRAADEAVRQLAHTLDTGEEWPFARAARVAILPSALPERIVKRYDDGRPSAPIVAERLVRTAEVLLQPDLGLMAELVDPDVIRVALTAASLKPADLVAGGSPSSGALGALGQHLAADYYFVSRASDVDLVERQLAGGPGVEREADAEVEAWLVRAVDGRVLWHDHGEATSRTRTEMVRGKPRQLRDEQLVADALRAAFAGLRYSFEEYRRRFER